MTDGRHSLQQRLRRQTRVEVYLFGHIEVEERIIPVEICELSLSGVRVICRERLPYGRRCDLVIQLDNRHNAQLPVHCDARIVRHLDDGMGLAIVRIRDPEAFDMLTNLVLLHAADPARAARELSRLPRPKPSARHGDKHPSDRHRRHRRSARFRF